MFENEELKRLAKQADCCHFRLDMKYGEVICKECNATFSDPPKEMILRLIEQLYEKLRRLNG